MTLRHKTLLTTGLPILVAMGVLHFILPDVWLSRLWQVEVQEGQQEAELARRLLDSRLDRLRSFTQD